MSESQPPSREKDALVARALYPDADISGQTIVLSRHPNGRRFAWKSVPAYTTGKPMDSTHWGEMWGWLEKNTIRRFLKLDIDDFNYGVWYGLPLRQDFEGRDCAAKEGLSEGDTIGDALANAILSVSALLSAQEGA